MHSDDGRIALRSGNIIFITFKEDDLWPRKCSALNAVIKASPKHERIYRKTGFHFGVCHYCRHRIHGNIFTAINFHFLARVFTKSLALRRNICVHSDCFNCMDKDVSLIRFARSAAGHAQDVRSNRQRHGCFRK